MPPPAKSAGRAVPRAWGRGGRCLVLVSMVGVHGEEEVGVGGGVEATVGRRLPSRLRERVQLAAREGKRGGGGVPWPVPRAATASPCCSIGYPHPLARGLVLMRGMGVVAPPPLLLADLAVEWEGYAERG